MCTLSKREAQIMYHGLHYLLCDPSNTCVYNGPAQIHHIISEGKSISEYLGLTI